MSQSTENNLDLTENSISDNTNVLSNCEVVLIDETTIPPQAIELPLAPTTIDIPAIESPESILPAQDINQPVAQDINQPVAQDNLNADDFANYLTSLWGSETNFDKDVNELKPLTNISKDILEKFKKSIEERYNDIRVLGNFSYTNKLEKEVRLKKNELSKDDIKISYIAMNDLYRYNKINTETMNKINKVYVSEKVKDANKNKMDLGNYRFIQVHSKPLKLIDRLWCLRVFSIVKDLDTSIFKSNLLKGMTDSTIKVADENTQSRNNVILIDIAKAFDSCEYDIIEDLIESSLARKTTEKLAVSLTKQYMYILKNRNLYFKDKQINYKKGLPTGFPSSNIVFSLIMDEIIHRWRFMTKEFFTIGKDFKINIYVDDIYLKIINQNIKDPLVITLVDTLQSFKLKVNFEKCKADAKLNLDFFTDLEETDMYLGIPFTRDTKKYTDLMLKKYGNNETYKTVYDKLKTENHPERKQLFGFFNYKLKPLLNGEDLIDFIEKYLV